MEISNPTDFSQCPQYHVAPVVGLFSGSVSGDIVITGVGFRPVSVDFMARDNLAANKNASWGWDNGVYSYCMKYEANGVNISMGVDYSIHIYSGAGQFVRGLITAMGNDGFTVTITQAGIIDSRILYKANPT